MIYTKKEEAYANFEHLKAPKLRYKTFQSIEETNLMNLFELTNPFF